MLQKYRTAQKCPVCKSLLGTRDTSIFFMALCDECNTYYSWDPHMEKPKAQLNDHKKKEGCGCGGCGR